VAYVRVSTREQADGGVSLAAQRERIAAYAALYGLDVVSVYEDAGVSASTLDRPGLAAALDALAAGAADALVVAKLDRLTRSVRDLGDLIDADGPLAAGRAALLSVGEQVDTRTAAGRLVLNVLASVAQWERETIGERTSAAMLHMSATGVHVGGAPPYGYAVGEGGRLVEVDAEQAVMREARALSAAGLSLRAVAAALAARGLVSRTGRPFAATQVARMVAA
jgi:DNA invertase Pin-like site-specific DNA recombinase